MSNDERARTGEERGRETIEATAMIAPTPDLIRQVMALHSDVDVGDGTDQPAATSGERDRVLPPAD